jgi:hypothetical protein
VHLVWAKSGYLKFVQPTACMNVDLPGPVWPVLRLCWVRLLGTGVAQWYNAGVRAG